MKDNIPKIDQYFFPNSTSSFFAAKEPFEKDDV
jgi:hypothetical protein